MRWLVREGVGGWGIAGLVLGGRFLLYGRMLAVEFGK